MICGDRFGFLLAVTFHQSDQQAAARDHLGSLGRRHRGASGNLLLGLREHDRRGWHIHAWRGRGTQQRCHYHRGRIGQGARRPSLAARFNAGVVGIVGRILVEDVAIARIIRIRSTRDNEVLSTSRFGAPGTRERASEIRQ